MFVPINHINIPMSGIRLMLFLLIAITLASCTKSRSAIPVPMENSKGNLNKGDTIRVAIYRGIASCNRCSQTVKSAIEKMGFISKIDFVGPNEQIDITDKTLSRYDIYVQPGGGQDIAGAFGDLDGVRAVAIRNFVARGGRYLGLCMGAYLAGVSYIGLIDDDLDSEVKRPGFPVRTIEDASVVVDWQGHEEYIFYQDGPYLFPKSNDHQFLKIATYENGDLAIARYAYGKGLVILTGPHPEADNSWFDDAEIPSTERPTRNLFKDIINSFYQ
ncbi:BPL-N domain-containing protein [Chitinophaga nivalis]|uniref:BPL-N domain-containing protein n=1 Tax=Chitinophaga nivalis TaxID=2991709 RepID=A0ABT3IK44_9BACT|nr:BPL-N domain-containing protein [Chitinophaga nivalis]MCW3465973.1 BPL-N domain-containing protein [Chitinophaga nivalis]MCW3484336.1 BPL-N domain-containing protein [Chitinophaga nivalis]